MLSGGSVSALVTWDALTAMQGGGFIQNYVVQVFQNGQLLPEVSPTARMYLVTIPFPFSC